MPVSAVYHYIFVEPPVSSGCYATLVHCSVALDAVTCLDPDHFDRFFIIQIIVLILMYSTQCVCVYVLVYTCT